jgi:hypothetical protein
MNPDERCLARFMQQRQSSVAAFIHYCLLVRRDPELLQGVLSGAEGDELSELVEVSD